MRSMTGYGRGEAVRDGTKFIVELTSVNRKQGEIALNLPRDFMELEPKIRQAINARISRGRVNVLLTSHQSENARRALTLDLPLARSYQAAMVALQKQLGVGGEISIQTILQAPGVMRPPEETTGAAWPAIESALETALTGLIKMREREGKHLARDLTQRIKTIRQRLKQVEALHPGAAKKFRAAMMKRIAEAGLPVSPDDERLAKEILIFADRSDIAEELTRLESHLKELTRHFRKDEPVGRALEFIVQEIFRELNTLGAKANDAGIAQAVVACKTELEKIREQVQNLE